MKITYRLISLLLASLMLLPMAASCSADPQDSGDAADTTAAPVDTTAADTTTEAETGRNAVKDTLPEGLNFSGETFQIYVAAEATNTKFFAGQEELNGDIVNDTVHARNQAVEERLGITLQHDGKSDAYNTVAKSVSNLILANDDTYDLYMGHQYGVATLVPQKLFQNAYDVKHLDFTQPWWNNEYMNATALGDKYRFLLAGDYFITCLTNERVVFYNKDLYGDLYGDPDGLYTEVLDGKWTIDRMCELSAGAYADLNGDGKSDPADRLGFVANKVNASVDGFVYGTDIAFTTRDEEGFVQLSMVSDDAVLLLEKLITLFSQTGTNHDNGGTQNAIFKAGTALFLGNGMLSTAEDLRDMEQDFGFLPHPKLDEEQKNYRTLVHDQAFLGCIPVTNNNTDMTGAVLEALCSESYRTVVPAWYESALKLKYARDDISSQMIDLLNSTMSTDFIYAYNASLDSIGTYYQKMVKNGTVAWASHMKKVEPAAAKKLQDLIDTFKGN